MNTILCIFLFLISWSAWSADDGWSGQGEITFEWRNFYDDDQKTSIDEGRSVMSRLESSYEKGSRKAVLRFFSRVDQLDNERDFVVFEDLYYRQYFGADEEWQVKFGYQVYNWSATEAFHPADVINSKHYDGDFERPEKRGELSLEVERTFGEGRVTAYLFPRYEKPLYPGEFSRLGTGLPFHAPVWMKKNSERAGDRYDLQWGLRLDQSFAGADIALFYLNHMDRDHPLLVYESGGLTPYHFKVQDFGTTIQFVYENLIFKLESSYRDFVPSASHLTLLGGKKTEDYYLYAWGVEYLIPHDSGKESYLFLEGQHVGKLSRKEREDRFLFQNDMMMAWRLAFNDTLSKELFLSLFFDLQREHEYLVNMSYSQRITDVWKASVGLRVYDAPEREVIPRGMQTFHKDHSLYINVNRFF